MKLTYILHLLSWAFIESYIFKRIKSENFEAKIKKKKEGEEIYFEWAKKS